MVKSIELRNHLRLQYVEQGDPAGTPVLLLHGVTDSWRSFEPVLLHLPPSLRALALTQRGHGDAARPSAGYATRDFAADIADFLDALGIASAVIVGHSMGSTHALRFAIDYPKRASALVLAGCFATYAGNANLVEFWRSTIAPLTDPVDPALAREFQESTLAQPVPPAFLDMVVAESLKLPARVWRAVFERFYDDDFADELEAIRAPVLLLWGDRDALVPWPDQAALLARLLRARLRVYRGVGHALHWEAPQRFAADVAAFARSHHPAARNGMALASDASL